MVVHKNKRTVLSAALAAVEKNTLPYTVMDRRPRWRRRDKTLLPALVDILFLKPWVRLLFLLWGWYVLFIKKPYCLARKDTPSLYKKTKLLDEFLVPFNCLWKQKNNSFNTFMLGKNRKLCLILQW